MCFQGMLVLTKTVRENFCKLRRARFRIGAGHNPSPVACHRVRLGITPSIYTNALCNAIVAAISVKFPSEVAIDRKEPYTFVHVRARRSRPTCGCSLRAARTMRRKRPRPRHTVRHVAVTRVPSFCSPLSGSLEDAIEVRVRGQEERGGAPPGSTVSTGLQPIPPRVQTHGAASAKPYGIRVRPILGSIGFVLIKWEH